MKHRYTVKELLKEDDIHYMNDIEFLRQVLRDRMESVTNVYAPFYTRASKVIAKLDEKIQKQEKEL